MKKKEEILGMLAKSLRSPFRDMPEDLGQLEEIRLRVGQPVAVTWEGNTCFLSEQGSFCEIGAAHRVTGEEMRETVNYLSSYSRYAFEDKIRQGFLTIQGGHRVGLAGRVILEEERRVKTISPITCLNLRIARQRIGCGAEVLTWLRRGRKEAAGDGPSILDLYDTLLISPPGMGKTTLLRDLIRLLSHEMPVGVVDERCELAACYQGIAQNDLGPCADILDGCPKEEGLLMLVRSMAPKIIAVDEIGGNRDCQAVEYAMNSGCRILATAHGAGYEDLKQRPVFGQWIQEKRFSRYVEIRRESTGFCYRVCNQDGGVLWTGGDRR